MIRGIRNNNPGNIERTGTKWKGMSLDQSLDHRFIVFDTPEHGIRAIARILLGDWRKGKSSIFELINEWAPPVENDTSAYVDAVAKAVGVNPFEDCNVQAVLPDLIKAIILHENGVQPYADAQIAKGIAMESA